MKAARPDELLVARALELARSCAASGDVPVGAVVVAPDGRVIGEGRNEREAYGDPTAHAEVVALRAAASATGSWRLEGCTLAVTLEPCVMCAGAIVLARVARVVFGAWDPKAGACGSVWDLLRDRRLTHRVEVVGGVLEGQCADALLAFFDEQRSLSSAPAVTCGTARPPDGPTTSPVAPSPRSAARPAG